MERLIEAMSRSSKNTEHKEMDKESSLIQPQKSIDKDIAGKDSCIHSKDKCDDCICRELEEFCMNMQI